jgi:hypothetical protein
LGLYWLQNLRDVIGRQFDQASIRAVFVDIGQKFAQVLK